MLLNNEDGRYAGFLLSMSTLCGTPLIAGGLCRAGYEEQSRRDLFSLSALKFRADDDIYDIDFRLAQAVRESCGHYIWAVGVTAALPDAPYSTGGVIGSPHVDIASANSRVERIGHGLYLRAFPGGPGCVAACDGEDVLGRLSFDSYPSVKEKADTLARRLRDCGVKSFFVVTDGSGPESKGSFVLESNGKQSRLNF